MTPDLRPCCQQAAIDGHTPVEHWPVCDARADDPQEDALFDLPGQSKQGGQHLLSAGAALTRAEAPDA
jgi:hypothetical protein